MNSKPIPKGSTKPRTVIFKWVKAIPKGSHGSGDLQKRLWRLTSDFVRIRDWTNYTVSVSTGLYIENWRDGDAGHYKPYSTCNGIFKFDEINIHLQDKKSNGFGGADDGYKFGDTLKVRYGPNILNTIEVRNRETPNTLKTTQILEKMEYYILSMGNFYERPDYYDRVMELRQMQ